MRPAAALALALAAAFLPVACGRKEPGGAPAAVRPAVPRGEPIADRGELKTAIKAVFDGATDRRVDPAQVAAVAASLPAGDSDIDDAALRALWHASIVDTTAAAIADDASLRLARDPAASPGVRAQASRGAARAAESGRVDPGEAASAIIAALDGADAKTAWACLETLFWLAARRHEVAPVARARLEDPFRDGNSGLALPAAVDAVDAWLKADLMSAGDAAPFLVRAAFSGEHRARTRAPAVAQRHAAERPEAWAPHAPALLEAAFREGTRAPLHGFMSAAVASMRKDPRAVAGLVRGCPNLGPPGPESGHLQLAVFAPETVPELGRILAEGLEAADAPARRAGAETLGSLHRLGTLDRGTVAALERMRDGDPDADVRAAAGKALDR